MKKVKSASLWFAVCIGVAIVATGCTLTGDDSDDDGSAKSGLGGSWIASVTPPIMLDGNSPELLCDAIVAVFNDGAFTLTHYCQTEQIFGQKGSYTEADGTVNCTLTHMWSAENSFIWSAATESFEIRYEIDGDSAFIIDPEDREFTFTSVDFSVPAAIEGTWFSGGITLTIDDDGEFLYSDTYEEPTRIQYGTGEVGSGLLHSIVTVDSVEGAGLSWEFLTPYAYDAGADTLTLTYPGDEDVVFARSEDAEDVAGEWYAAIDPAFQFDPDDVEALADAMLVELSSGDCRLVLFADGEQVAGQTGTYTVAGGFINYLFGEEWDASLSVWEDDEDPVGENFLPLAYEIVDGDVVLTDLSASDVVLDAVSFSSPGATLAGTWTATDITLIIGTGGSFDWTDTLDGETYTQSGFVEASPTLLHSTITEDSDLGDGLSREYVSSYTLAGDSLTIFVAGEAIPLSRE